MRKFACWTEATYILAILVFITAIQSRATDIVWTNTAGGNWSTAANWNPNQVPAAGDSAFITNAGTYAVSVTASATVSALNLGAPGAAGNPTLQITAGTLTVTNTTGYGNSIISIAGGWLAAAGPFNSAGRLNHNTGTWQLRTASSIGSYNFTNGELRGGTLTVTNCNWVNGNMNADANGDKTIVPPGGVLNFLGTADRYFSYNAPATAGRNFDNHGTWNWTSNSILYPLQTGCVINNYGMVNVSGSGAPATASQITAYPGYGAPVWNNYGTFTKTAGTNIFYFASCYLNNSGAINFQSGTLSLYASTVSNTGPISIQNGTLQSYGSTVTNTGAITLTTSNSIFQTDNGGSFAFGPSSRLVAPGVNSIRLNSGSMILHTTNVISPSILIAGGTLVQRTNIVVPVINQASGTLTLGVPANLASYNMTNGLLRGRTITITNFNWIEGNFYADINGDKTIIPAGGVLNMPGTASRILSYDLSATAGRGIDNFGTWNWTSNSVLYGLNAGCVINNHGVVNVTGGGISSSSAQFTAYPGYGAPVWNNYGTFTKSPGSNIFYFASCYLNNFGTLDFQSGVLAVHAATFTNSALLNLSPTATFQNENGASSTFLPSSTLNCPGTDSFRVPSGNVYLQTPNIVTPSLAIVGGVLWQQTNNVVPIVNQTSGTWRLSVTTTVDTYNLNGGELRGGTLTVTNLNWVNGNMNADVNGDKTIIAGGGVLNFPGTATRYLSYNVGATRGRDLDNYGTWYWTSNSLLVGVNPAVVNNYGSVIASSAGLPGTSAQFTYNAGSSAPVWNNYGSFLKTAANNVFYFAAVYLNNSGNISAQGGTLSLYSSIVHNTGAINVQNATLQNYASTSTNSTGITLDAASFFTMDNGGTFVFEPQSSFSSPGLDHVRINSGTVLLRSTNFITPSVLIAGGVLWHQTNNTIPVINESSGTWRLSGNTTVETYNLTNGELRGGILTVTNLNWIAGSMNADGTGDKTIIPAGGLLNFPGNATRNLSYYPPAARGRDIDNHGTWSWSGNSLLVGVNPAVINNYGAVNVTGTGVGTSSQFTYSAGYSSPVWNNRGTFTKSSGAGIFYFTVAYLNNFGTLDFQSGTMAVHASIATNLTGGSIQLGSGALLINENNSSTTLNPGSTLVGANADSFRIPSGNVYLRSTDITIPSLLISGGTLNQETNNVIPMVNQNAGLWRLNTPASVNTYNFTNGELRGADLTVNNFNWMGGQLNADGPGSNLVTVATTLNISGNTAKSMSYWTQPGRSLINNGVATWGGVGITGQGGATFHNNNSLTVTGDVAFPWGGSGAVSVFRNSGTYTKSGGAGNANFGSTTITNSGTFAFNSGTISLGSFHQSGGTSFLNTNFSIGGSATIEGGTFTGRGNVAGLLYNNGTLNPGTSPGLITSATFSNAPAGTINIELNGTNTPGVSYDQVRMSGAVALNGTMNVTLADNFAPQLSNRFTVMTFASRSGTFPTIIPPPGIALQADYTNTSLILTVVGLTNAPLQITSFPSNQTVYTPDPATFLVGVSGTTPISYQWQFNSNNIIGATNSGFSISSTSVTNAGNYRILITDGVGATTNASATLTVIPYDGTIFWTNTAGGLWATATNWSPNRVPGVTNHAVITNAGTYTVAINSPATAGRLTLGLASTNGQPRLNISHDFTLEGPGVVGMNGVIDFVYNLYGAGSLSNNGTFYWGSGSMTGTGAFINGTNGSVQTYANSAKYLNRRVNNFGLFNFNASDGFGIHGGNGALFTNEIGGRITIADGQTGFSVQSGATNTALYNHGLITANGAPSRIYMPFFNEPDGTLLVNNSCYVGSGTNRGTINIPHPLASVSVVAPTFAFNSGTVLQGYGAIGVGFSGVLNVNTPIVCSNAFGISAGQLYNPALNLNANLTTYGTVSVGTGDLNINPGVTLDAQTLTLSWFYQTYTHAYITSMGNVIANNLNLSYGSFFNSGPITVRNNLNFTGASLAHSGNGSLTTQTNSSTSIGQASVSVFPHLSGGVWNNYGTVGWTFGGVLNVYDGAGIINHTNATMNLSGNGIFVNHGGTNWLVNRGLIQRNGFASTPSLDLITTNYNTVLLNNTAMWLGRFLQLSGKTDIGGGIINGAQFDIRGGELIGAANIQSGGTIYNAANLRPGSEIGTLNLSGNYTNAAAGTYHMQIGGNLAHQYDRLNIGGTATLAGTLNLVLTNFFPPIGNTFTAMTFTARSGQFDNVVSPNYQFEVVYTPTEVLLLASNALPVVTLTVGSTQIVCQPFGIQASATDPDGTITNLTLLLNGSPMTSSTGAAINSSMETDFPQFLTFTARATDNRGGTNSMTQVVEVTTLPLHVLTLGGLRSNSVFKICMLGEDDAGYFVLANSNLLTTNWTNIGSMEYSSGIYRFFDTNITSRQRYYRSLQTP